MGATYTRQSSFTDGDTITADLFNDEYDQLLAAFAVTTGHTHDGTAAEGGPITKLLGTAITIGSNGADVAVTFDGESNDGLLTWMEDEDYFQFSDDLLLTTTEKVQFRDTAIYINSSVDGQLDIVADTEVQIAATTIDMNGAADISGNLAVGGNLTVAGNATVTGTTTFNGGTLTLGDSASDNVVFGADVDSSIIPDDDDTYDLGSSSQQWRNLFIDGTAEIDTLAINGTTVTSTAAELNILDGVTSTAAELNILDGKAFFDEDNFASNSATGIASQQSIKAYVDNITTTNITSTGALNTGSITSGFGNIDTGSSTITTTGLISGGSLDIDNVLINGTTIGHTDDTDLITLANGVVTVAGEVSMTTLDIGGTNVTSTAAELNTLDGITAVVGELNALDIGSTAVGTAVASKAVILDSNKDYTGIRNLTLTGNLTIPDDGLFAATNTAGNILVADGTNFNSIAVSGLSEISTVASGDTFIAVDASGGGLKKITRSAIVSGLATSSAISNLSEDDTPQLGGNLDLNGNDIVTTSNATLDLAPNGTGTVVVRGNSNSGAIVFNCESNSHGQKIIAQPHSASVTNTMLLPAGSNSTLVSLVSTDTLTNKTLTSPKINENVAVTSTATELNLLDGVTSTTAELNILDGVTSTAAELNALDGITAVVGELNALDLGSTAVGTAIASKAVILDSNKDYTGIRNFSITGNLSVGGTTTVVDTVTMNAQNAVLFEGATADAHETTLTIVDPTADRTINLPNQSGTVPVLAAASNTAVTSTPEELNILDGVTSTTAELNILDGVTSTAAELNILDGVTSTAAELNILDGVTSTAAELNALDGITAVVGELNALDIGSTAVGTAVASKAVILDSNKDYTGLRNFTVTGELDAATLDISGNADIDGTTNLDVVDIDGAVDMASTLLVTGVATLTAKSIANAGMSVKNGATSAGFVEFFEDSDNGTNKVTLIGPASTADITLTLPAAAGTLITSASAIDEATALAIALG
jgi:hypothetical protein